MNGTLHPLDAKFGVADESRAVWKQSQHTSPRIQSYDNAITAIINRK